MSKNCGCNKSKNDCDDHKKKSCCEYCVNVFKNEVLPILRLGYSQADIFAPFLVIENGQASGFFVELAKEIASRLCNIKSIQLVELPDAGILDALEAGVIDATLSDFFNITLQRLQQVGAVQDFVISGDVSQLAFFFLDSAMANSVNTILGDPAIGATILDALVTLRDSGNPPLIYYFAEGSISEDTLLNLPGGPYPNIAVLPGGIVDADEAVAFLEANAPLGGLLLGTTPAEGQLFINDDTTGTLKFVAVDADPSQVPLGGGFLLNKADCSLMLQWQCIVDQLIEEGVYEAIANRLIDEEFPDASPEAFFPFSFPPKCESVRQRFIPVACLKEEIKEDLCCKPRCKRNINVRV